METATKKQIEKLISYYEDDAYAQTDEVKDLARELIEEDEELEDAEDKIWEAIDESLEGYEYIECEYQGAFYRHIWHKI